MTPAEKIEDLAIKMWNAGSPSITYPHALPDFKRAMTAMAELAIRELAPKWIPYSERWPTAADADDDQCVWVFDTDMIGPYLEYYAKARPFKFWMKPAPPTPPAL